MLGGQNKERERPIEILPTSHGTDPVGVTIGQVVLCVRMTSIGESFQERRGLLDEIFTFLFVDGRERSRGGGQARMGLAIRGGVGIEGFGGFDHKDGKLEDEFRVVGLFRILSVEL